MLNLNIRNKRANQRSLLSVEEESLGDIAVIGLSARLPQADDPDSFWGLLCDGFNAIGPFPRNRRQDVQDYVGFKGDSGPIRFCLGSYLANIDQFDYSFFKITAKEASLMDPHQRLFLETCWSAIEDSGYGGQLLAGTRTGVYVGYSGRGEYNTFVSEVDPESVILAEAGNIHSIIASRIAYILDLKGPSMLIDTACSSSLVAVHAACQALRRQECDTAITGGVKITLLPFEAEEQLGIESGSGMTRTFDDNSDGTVFGEGCVALILKPLQRALRDHDSIYAIIKGSATNQDGRSAGITAPNVLAQEECIVQAWQQAGIDPATVSYMEAHGTGTRLGDPVEIQAMTQAFRRYTDKRQFCAVGSVKSVYGHLDHAAGILGLLKVILMLKQKVIPPTLHFDMPNRNIDFVNSPVYVSQYVQPWKSEDDAPRRCGINSFGLSGTNCHMVLEEAPCLGFETEERVLQRPYREHLLTLSSQSKHQLLQMIRAQRHYCERHTQTKLKDICFTLNCGRTHVEHRIAIVANDLSEVLRKLFRLEQEGLKTFADDGIYYGWHTIISDIKKERVEGELSESDKRLISGEAVQWCEKSMHDTAPLHELSRLYVRGAELPWSDLYPAGANNRLHLPGYIFARHRCWPEISYRTLPIVSTKQSQLHLDHPLIEMCAWEGPGLEVYVTHFSMKQHWVLAEHRVGGSCLLPGTAYMEMMYAYCEKHYGQSTSLELKDVMYISPLKVNDTEPLEVQMLVKKYPDRLEFVLASKATAVGETGQWHVHCEATAVLSSSSHRKQVSIDTLKEHLLPCDMTNETTDHEELAQLKFGPRWLSLRQSLRAANNEALAELRLPEKYHSDLDNYRLHPALLDIALNAVTQLTGNGLYLPLCYDCVRIYSPLPTHIFSHITRRSASYGEKETVTYDVSLYDTEGTELLRAEGFTVKKVHVEASTRASSSVIMPPYYQVRWVPATLYPTSFKSPIHLKGCCLVIRHSDIDISLEAAMAVYTRVIDVQLGDSFHQLGVECFSCSGSAEDYERLFSAIRGLPLSAIIHATTIKETMKATDSIDQLRTDVGQGIEGLKQLVSSMVNARLREPIDMILLTTHAYRITGLESFSLPQNAAYLTWGQGISREYPHMSFKAIDIDEKVSVGQIAAEIRGTSSIYITALRGQMRYQKELALVQSSDCSKLEQEASNLQLREQGVYVITGGTGALGSEFAKYLASIGHINVALVSRSAGNRTSWDETLIQRIEQLKEHIHQHGSTVELYQADIGDEFQFDRLVARLKERYGRINGIVHAAGVASSGYVIRRSAIDTEQVLSPKIYGTWLLHQLAEQEAVEFFIVFSSVSSLYGMAGQADYSSANAYMDALASERHHGGQSAFSVQWAPWQEIGMAAEHGVEAAGVFDTLTVPEGELAFKMLLGKSISSLVIGRISSSRLALAIEALDIHLQSELLDSLNRGQSNLLASTQPSQTKGKGSNEFDYDIQPSRRWENKFQVQKAVRGVWSRVLGSPDIDIYDSFMTLGGDSITATRLFKELDRLFPATVDIGSVFANPSVLQMSQYIESQLGMFTKGTTNQKGEGTEAETPFDLDDILRKVRNHTLSVTEALNLI